MFLKALYRAPVRTAMSVMVGQPSAAAWPIKTGRRCDYCGSQFGDMRLPWDWPADNPNRTVWLHPRCEAPWWDCRGAPEGVR